MSGMTFAQAKASIRRYAGQGTSGDFDTQVGVLINSVYKRILDKGPIPHEKREFAFPVDANAGQVGMPLYVRRVLNIEDPTNFRSIWTSTPRAYDKAYPGTTETGTPRLAYSLGMKGVQANPKTDGKLSIESSSATDVTGGNFKVRVTGFDTAGILVTELVTINGTTAVNTVNNYDSTLGVERIVKEPASGFTFTGNIIVKDDDGNTISTIPVFWLSPDYEWVEFHPNLGSTAITYTLRVEMRKPPLVNDGDWPEFDQEFHDLLIWGVTQDLLPSYGKGTTADRHRLTWKERWAEFTGNVEEIPSATWTFGNVQAQSGVRNRPHRPLILGVDHGLA